MELIVLVISNLSCKQPIIYYCVAYRPSGRNKLLVRSIQQKQLDQFTSFLGLLNRMRFAVVRHYPTFVSSVCVVVVSVVVVVVVVVVVAVNFWFKRYLL